MFGNCSWIVGVSLSFILLQMPVHQKREQPVFPAASAGQFPLVTIATMPALQVHTLFALMVVSLPMILETAMSLRCLKNLKPNTRYYYGVVTKVGLVDTRMEFDRPWPSFRTLPDATSFADSMNNKNGEFNFSFSIGCCSRQLPRRTQ